jgi:hypothetical protein
MAKYTHRPLCPFKPGQKIRWKDRDGDWLTCGGTYTVKAVNGHIFNIEGCPVNWGYEETQFVSGEEV